MGGLESCVYSVDCGERATSEDKMSGDQGRGPDYTTQ